jgi:hypothetical protein
LKVELSKSLSNKIIAMVEKYELEAGILKDADYYLPDEGMPGIPKEMRNNKSLLAGGPVRKRSSKKSGQKISDISQAIRNQQDVDYLSKPFSNRNNKDLRDVLDNFFNYAFGRSTERRLTNAMRALIRNPILRQDYGGNLPSTEREKGFNRYLFDTGQFFRTITARVIRKVR